MNKANEDITCIMMQSMCSYVVIVFVVQHKYIAIVSMS